MATQRIYEVLEEVTPEGDFTHAAVAEKAFAFLAEQEPETLAEWLEGVGLRELREASRRRSMSLRARARRQAGPAAFAAASARFENGDTDALVPMLEVDFCVDDDGTRRRVADMRGEDHAFVAACYQFSSQREAMEAAFHTAVARKVGKQRTADVLNEEQYRSLYQSIAGAK